jgi:hypothetical protein
MRISQSIQKKLGREFKMVTGTQLQNAWAPWIRDLLRHWRHTCLRKSTRESWKFGTLNPLLWKASPCHDLLKEQPAHRANQASVLWTHWISIPLGLLPTDQPGHYSASLQNCRSTRPLQSRPTRLPPCQASTPQACQAPTCPLDAKGVTPEQLRL